MIDPQTLAVKRTFPTPQIRSNHPLQFDAAYRHVLVGGQNGTIATYDVSGKLVGTVAVRSSKQTCGASER